MIYSVAGEPCKIVAYCGKHRPEWAPFPLVLVKTRIADNEDWYSFAVNLRADSFDEVEKAVIAAPEIELDETALKAALAQAE